MKEGPDIARIGALIGDPARAGMLVALMSGKALTAGELACEAGITPSTASSHLRKLEEGGLIWPRKQGRHRYFALRNEEVGRAVESLLGLAEISGHLRTRPGPTDPALRQARVCYNHLAGTFGVRLFDSLSTRGFLEMSVDGEGVTLTRSGQDFARDFGIDLQAVSATRRPLCRACLDWSERRSHLAGPLAEAMLTRMLNVGWAERLSNSRAIQFTRPGERAFQNRFPI